MIRRLPVWISTVADMPGPSSTRPLSVAIQLRAIDTRATYWGCD